MANNEGTLIIAPVRPQSDVDTYPVAYAQELKGGHHQVATELDKNTMPSERKTEGMLCTVIANGKTYQLSGGTWQYLHFEFLNNLNITGETNDQVLTYDQGTGKWINKDIIGGGGRTEYSGITNLGTGGTQADIVLGFKDTDRGFKIDYTLSRSGITNQYQIGTLYIIHNGTNIKITDELVSTEEIKLVTFNAIYNGFGNVTINLSYDVNDGNEPVWMEYYYKKFNFYV